MCYEKRDPKIARECFIRDQGGNMDQYTATELAYKNGYAQGKKDAVKHGKWTEKDNSMYDQYMCENVRWSTYICSECNGEVMKDFNYCPNCGSRMDGGNEDG